MARKRPRLAAWGAAVVAARLVAATTECSRLGWVSGNLSRGHSGRFVALVDDAHINLEGTAQDRSVAAAKLERFVHTRQVEDGEAADQLLGLGERTVHRA